MDNEDLFSHWTKRAKAVGIVGGALPADPVKGIHLDKLVTMVLQAEENRRSKMFVGLAMISAIVSVIGAFAALAANSITQDADDYEKLNHRIHACIALGQASELDPAIANLKGYLTRAGQMADCLDNDNPAACVEQYDAKSTNLPTC